MTMAEFSRRDQALKATQPATSTTTTQNTWRRKNTAEAITTRVRRGSSRSIPP